MDLAHGQYLGAGRVRYLCALALIAFVWAGLCAVPALTIDYAGVYAAGDQDVVYCIDYCDDDTLTNWLFGTNIIGNGTNFPPEQIDIVRTNGNRFYRINIE